MFTISNLFRRGANYLFTILLARSISVLDFGSYSVYVNIFGAVLLITNFGFSEYLLVNSKEEEQKNKNLHSFILASLFLFSAILLSLLIFKTDDKYLAVLVLFKMFFETSIYNILLSYHQVEKKLIVMTATNLALGFSVILLSLLFYFKGASIQTYLFYITLSYSIILISILIKIKFKVISLKHALSYLTNKAPELKYYGVSMITVPIYMMAPTVIGTIILPNKEIAQYQIAFSVANILLLISVSLLQEGYTTFLSHQNNPQALVRSLKHRGTKIVSINLFLLILFIVFGESFLLLVYKKEAYLSAYYPLVLLLIANLIFMIASIAAVLMVVLKLQKEKAKYHLEFIIISAILGTLFTYNFGIIGLAVSYILLYSYSAFRYLIKYIHIKKRFKI